MSDPSVTRADPGDRRHRSTRLRAGGAGSACDVRVVGRPVFDFDRPDTIEAIFRSLAPRLVVNAAAYTAVDAAETDAEAAYRANRDGPAILARLCAAADIPLIHVSTDYVFDGAKPAPYVETDPVAPQGVYGASKLAGELDRTGWLPEYQGIFHAAGNGQTSWSDGTISPSQRSRKRAATAPGCRSLCQSPPRTGRRQRNARPTRGSIAPGSARCSMSRCRTGDSVSPRRSTQFSPARRHNGGRGPANGCNCLVR